MTNDKEKILTREEYPFETLEEFGLSKEMLLDLPDYIHQRLEYGDYSPVIQMSVEQPFGQRYFFARFCFRLREDGDVDTLFVTMPERTDFSMFTDSQREKLLKGRAIVADISVAGREEKQRAYIQYDAGCKNIFYVPSQIVARNLLSLSGLSVEQLEKIQDGELETIKIEDSNGRKANVTIGVNIFDDTCISVLLGDARNWDYTVHQKMPQYQFGSYGCWVCKDDRLHYVQEEAFTSEIQEALDKRAEQTELEQERPLQVQRIIYDAGNETEELREKTRTI